MIYLSLMLFVRNKFGWVDIFFHIFSALMRMLAANPHLVTDKVYLQKAVKYAIKCGVIDQWILARERGFLPKEESINISALDSYTYLWEVGNCLHLSGVGIR
jgi:hypothetical protein